MSDEVGILLGLFALTALAYWIDRGVGDVLLTMTVFVGCVMLLALMIGRVGA